MPFPVICPACGKSFLISDEIYELKVQGRVVSIKCRQCQTAIRIDGTKGTAQAHPSDAAPGGASPPKPSPGAGGKPADAQSIPIEAPAPSVPPAPVDPGSSAPAAPGTSPSRVPLARRAAESTNEAVARRTVVAAHPAPIATGSQRVAASPQRGAASPRRVASTPQRVAAVPPGAATQAALRSAAARTQGTGAAPLTEPKGPQVTATPARVATPPGPIATPPRSPLTSGRGASPPRTSDILAPTAAVTPLAAGVAESPAAGRGSAEATVEGSTSEPGAVLFAVDSSDGDRELTRDQIGRELQAGNLTSATLVWRDGLEEWLEIRQVPELASLLGKPEPRAEPSKSNAAQMPASAPRHFRARQPTLLMGAPPESAFGVPRETARSAGQSAQRPASAEPSASPATADTRRDLRAVRVPTPLSAREEKQPDKSPIPELGARLPRAKFNTPVPTDDEPTVLRSSEAVAELLKAGDTDKDGLTPVPPRFDPQNWDPSREHGQLAEGVPPPPLFGLGKAGAGGRLPARPALGTNTQPLTSLVVPEERATAQPTPAHSGPTAATSPRKPPMDTVRESPEAKRAWFPEQIPQAPAPPLPPVPPAPPAAIPNPLLPPTSIPNPFSRHPAAVPRPFSPSASSPPNRFAPPPSHAPAGHVPLVPSPLEPVRPAQVPLPDAMVPTEPRTPSIAKLRSSLTASVPPSLPPSLSSAKLFENQTAFRSKRNRVVWLVLAIALVAFAVASYVMSGSSGSP